MAESYNRREYWGNADKGNRLLYFLACSPSIPPAQGDLESELGRQYILPSNQSLSIRKGEKNRYFVALSPDSQEHILYNRLVQELGFKLPSKKRSRQEVPQEVSASASTF